MSDISCPYCNSKAVLCDSSEVYSKSYGMIWLCRPCKAWVGTHRNSKHNTPLGKLANYEDRQWRKKAHALFDPLWNEKIKRDGLSKKKARHLAYKWLSNKMNLEMRDCHIAHFSKDQCQIVINICQKYYRERISNE